ncbi:hypothetical protein ETC01_09295 [Geobacillus sp. NFOSA3]|nr:hypothetical protein [Geobacillus sp. NFOSA3]
MNIGIVFCGRCSSLMVDSGYDTPSTLKCNKCGNTKEFKVGHVNVEDEEINIHILLENARKNANL